MSYFLYVYVPYKLVIQFMCVCLTWTVLTIFIISSMIPLIFFLVCIFIILCLHFGSSFVTCFLKMSSKHKPKYIYFVVPSYSVFFYFDFWFVVMNHYFCLCCLIIPRVYDSLHFFVGSLNIKVCIRNINDIY